MPKYFRCFLIILLPFDSISQDGQYDIGGRNSALAGTSITLVDTWSIFNNIGGLGGIDRATVGAAYQSRYNIKALQVLGVGYSQPLKWFNTGIAFHSFGNSLFNQQNIKIGIGNQFQIVSLGLGVNFLQYRIESLGVKQVAALEFGGIVELTPKIVLGASIFNINQVALNETEDVPVVMKVGISIRPNDDLMLNGEVREELDQDTDFSFGVEYRIIQSMALRTGFLTEVNSFSLGLGIILSDFRMDYGFSMENVLGNIHEISLSYWFQ